ncbi:MAG: bacterial transcriptional activator domain-containing protein, partial [Gemmatimonadota bacterium]
GGPLRREKLVGTFWPERPEPRARNLLSQSLHYLREVLGPEALTAYSAGTVGLSREHVRCDLWEFQDALAEGDERRALTLCRGPLLDGFLPGIRAFEEWAELEREHHRRAALEAALELAGKQEQLSARVRWACWALERAPYDEVVLRRVMRLLREAGARALALKEYQKVCARLDRELQLSPSAETVALAEAIRAAEPEPGAPLPEVPPGPSTLAGTRTASQHEGIGTAPAPSETVPGTTGPSGEGPDPRVGRRKTAGALAWMALVALAGYAGYQTLAEGGPVSGPSGNQGPRKVLVGEIQSDVEWLPGVVVAELLEARLRFREGIGCAPDARTDPVPATEGRTRTSPPYDWSSPETAARLGCDVLVTGRVSTLGDDVLLYLRAVEVPMGGEIVALSEVLQSAPQLPGALSRLSAALGEAVVADLPTDEHGTRRPPLP